jgi:HEAT repeat protein
MSSQDIDLANAAIDQGKPSIAIDHLQDLAIAQLDAIDLDRVINLALTILIQGDFEQQWEIAKIFPKLGEGVIPPLLALTTDSDQEIEDRWFGARILGEFPDPEVVSALIALIHQDQDPELTAIATGALTKIGMPAIAAITQLLGTPDRRIAIMILAQIRHSLTIEPLLQVIDDPDPQLQTIIVEALGSFHDQRIPPLLILKLTDVTASVRQAAVVALCLRGNLVTELNLLQQLRPLLFDLDLAVCKATALGLARLPDPEVVVTLNEVLIDARTPTELKSAVILSLGWIGTKSAIDTLMTALPRISVDLIPEIFSSISKTERECVYASRQLIVYLQSLPMADPHLEIVKQSIATALGNLGNLDAVPHLVKLLDDPDDRLRLYTLTAIAKLSPPVASQSDERNDS